MPSIPIPRHIDPTPPSQPPSSPPPLRHGTRRAVRRRRRTKKSTDRSPLVRLWLWWASSPAVALTSCFVAVWCAFVLYAHGSLGGFWGGGVHSSLASNGNGDNGGSGGRPRPVEAGGVLNLRQRKQQQRREDRIKVSVKPGAQLPQQPVAASNIHKISNVGDNPWEGWQPTMPAIAAPSKCSWRKCLKNNATPECRPYCREDESDIGTAPPPPSESDWVPDVEIIRRMYQKGSDANGNAFPPPLSDELCEPMGPQGGRDDTNKRLVDEVPISINKGASSDTRILCMVYTMADAHANRIRAIRETWAGHCDGFLAFSTASDPRIPAISLPHEGKEAYGNMWQKVRSIWNFVGSHYADHFDYFFLGGDDLFVLPENLRSYLSTLGSPDDDHFAGRRFKGYGTDNYFNSGGAGYAISRGLLKRYHSVLDDPLCAPHLTTSMEDVETAACLRKKLKVGLTDTRDDRGRERFHPFAPGTHLTRKEEPGDWYEDYNKEWGLKLGTECCAPDSVSFHYIKKPAMVRHLFKLLYGNCASSS